MSKKLSVLAVCTLCALLTLPLIASETKFSSELTDADKERITQELETISEREAQTTCPLSGNAVAEGTGHDYMGYHIGTCCGGCAAKVKENPLGAIKTLRDSGQEPQRVETVSAQTVCPMSGKPVKEDIWAVQDNMLMKFCCPGCVQGFKDDPTATAEKLIEKGEVPVILTLEQKTCPVMGGPAKDDVTAQADGHTVKLCCAGCEGSVQENSNEILTMLRNKGIYVAPASE